MEIAKLINDLEEIQAILSLISNLEESASIKDVAIIAMNYNERLDLILKNLKKVNENMESSAM